MTLDVYRGRKTTMQQQQIHDFSLIFPWHFTVFHTLWQVIKSFLFFTLMVLTVPLQILVLLLKERIYSHREQIPFFKSSPQCVGRWV